MSAPLELADDGAGSVEVRCAGRPLLRYVVEPATPATESPRPYLHPLYTLDGDVLTNFRPNDHPWHHGLSLTLAAVNGTNFWGGPSYRAGEGYGWRSDHGRQVHREWLTREPHRLEHRLDWLDPQGNTLLNEERRLRVSVTDQAWSLDWTSRLRNVCPHGLRFDNYHSGGGLAGSHYTGLQFRGARALLDDHGDTTIGAFGADGARDEALHGQPAPWLEWHAQHDESLRRTRVRFENLGGPLPWFLRRSLPLVCFALHREAPLELPPGEILTLEHLLTFARA